MNPDRIELKIPTADGAPKVVAIRPPADEDWIAYYKVRRIILDRNGSVEQGNLSAEHDFIGRLLCEGSAQPDEFESALVVKTLSRSDVDSIEQDGGSFVVRVTVGGLPTEHRLRVPSAKQLMQHQRFRSVQDAGRGRMRVSVDIHGVLGMYQSLAVEAPDASLLAKVQALTAVMDEYSRLLGGEESF